MAAITGVERTVSPRKLVCANNIFFRIAGADKKPPQNLLNQLLPVTKHGTVLQSSHSAPGNAGNILQASICNAGNGRALSRTSFTTKMVRRVRFDAAPALPDQLFTMHSLLAIRGECIEDLTIALKHAPE